MREILFRGKTQQFTRWIYGDLNHYSCDDGLFIAENGYSMHRVFKETVGQYTGLTDKDGKKIFEGDIVEIEHSIHHYREDEFPETYRPRRAHSWHWDDEQKTFLYKRNYAVEWKAKDARWILRNGSDQHDLRDVFMFFHKGIVIGNIHDNPELLKGGVTDNNVGSKLKGGANNGTE